MAALLFVYALAPVAPAQRPELLLQFAVAPRVLQLVLAFVSLVAVGTATGQSAYDCSNHRCAGHKQPRRVEERRQLYSEQQVGWAGRERRPAGRPVGGQGRREGKRGKR
jgi:hypothetical protein